jgi:hypothetical protein
MQQALPLVRLGPVAELLAEHVVEQKAEQRQLVGGQGAGIDAAQQLGTTHRVGVVNCVGFVEQGLSVHRRHLLRQDCAAHCVPR